MDNVLEFKKQNNKKYLPWAHLEKTMPQDEYQVIESLDEKDRQLFEDIQNLSKPFIEKQFDRTPFETSKFFLIFSLNYYLLNLPTLARKMLSFVSLHYVEKQLITDIQKAVESRNLADEMERKLQYNKAKELWKDAEFFIVVTKILPYISKEKWFAQSHEFKTFLSELKEKSFAITLTQKLELVQ